MPVTFETSDHIDGAQKDNKTEPMAVKERGIIDQTRQFPILHSHSVVQFVFFSVVGNGFSVMLAFCITTKEAAR